MHPNEPQHTETTPLWVYAVEMVTAAVWLFLLAWGLPMLVMWLQLEGTN